jgi:hypothetical protein
MLKNKFFFSKIDKIIRAKTYTNYQTFLERINLKKKIKNSNITMGLEKLNRYY